jgi:hypothetical protein
VNVLNLVQEEEIVVESPSKAFEPLIVHYAETFIVPAAVGEYTIRPHVTRERCIKAFDPAVLAAMKQMEAALDLVSKRLTARLSWRFIESPLIRFGRPSVYQIPGIEGCMF